MSQPAIIIEGLSKAYRIGHQAAHLPTFREAIVNTLYGPFRRFRQLRAGGGGGEREETFWALKDVSFEVQPGEVVGIIGRNGAGKSTLLKILSRITEPTSGRAILHGRVASLLEVGTGFHPELTGRENIYLNGAILGMKKAEIARKFDEIVAFSEIEKFLDTPVKRYSSGMYVRLAFAVAAHLEPEILIVDEVLAVGDMAFQKKCLGKMQEVSRSRGRTVLFVSHNTGAVAELCGRTICLQQGVVVSDGPTQDVLQAYLSMSRSSGMIDLREWCVDRLGDGPMRVDYVATIGANGEVCSQFGAGESISFRVGLSGGHGAACILGIAIRDSQGRLVLHLNNTDDYVDLCPSTGNVEVEAKLDQNILNTGRYYVTVWVGDGFSIVNDRVGDCLAFQVEGPADRKIRCQASVLLGAKWGMR